MRNTIDTLLALTEPITESGCWIFNGHLDTEGYARVKMMYKDVRVHRVFYEHFIGPIPIGLVPDHLCRIRCCVNPWHLEIVTDRINCLRGNNPMGKNARKTHCLRGHPLAGENMYIDKAGARVCRACRREGDKRRWHEKKVING